MAQSSANGASPSCHTGGAHTATRYLHKKQQRHRGIRSSSPMGRVILINSPVDGGDDSEDIHTVTVEKSADGRLGFSVRGGSEHGLSIFVSKVEDGSSAEQAGLCVGDKLVEVNGVSLESITMSSAVKVLTGNSRLRVVLRRVGKVPGIRYSKEKTTWVDLIHRRMVVEESGRTPSDTSLDGALRRIVHLYTTSDDYCLGFNIRGGKEFGLGIYVSKLDPGGLAEQNGIKIGDQILAANGVSFEDISHSSAVEVLKSHTHIMLTIKEAGRYPAYKEMVAEYSWLNKLANGPRKASSQGSDTNSSTSSLSSGTPISSLSGLSHIMFPSSLPAFGTEMADVCVTTEEPSAIPSLHKMETAIQTDLLESELALRGGATMSTDTSRTLGATVLLKDTAIRSGSMERGGRCHPRTFSVGDSPKTAVLIALSRPPRPIRRSQSHITLAEDKQKREQQTRQRDREGGALRRSKTFVSLLFRGARKREASRENKEQPGTAGRHKSRSKSPSQDKEPFPGLVLLDAVEDMAQKLLEKDEVIAVLRHCRRFLTERVVEELVRPLLLILDRPEKLLLLREIRMLMQPTELGRFDSLVIPFELEAYEILKSRSARSPALRSPRAGLAPRRHLITPIPDYRGGFHLQPTQELERARQRSEEMARLQLSGTPLLDVPVDGHTANPLCPHPTTPVPLCPNWLLAESVRSTNRVSLWTPSDGTVRSLCHEVASLSPVPERGRSPFRNSHAKAKESTVRSSVSPAHPRRPLLSQVFATPVSVAASARREQVDGRDAHVHARPQEHELSSVTISKTKQSLGISISGGIESKVQPVVKIEKIFPGGAASTSEGLKAGFELVSVDGESLQGVTHQQAVDIIRKAFSNKATDPMVFVLKVPKGYSCPDPQQEDAVL